MKYAVGAEWQCFAPPTDAMQVAVADLLTELNPCVWTEAEPSTLLYVSLDVLAADYDAALATGRMEVLDVMARAGVQGTLVLLSAARESGQVTWRPDDS